MIDIFHEDSQIYTKPIRFFQQTGILNEDLLMKYAPTYKDVRIATNKKQSNETQIARKDEGLNSKSIRSMKKQSRTEKKCEKVKCSIEAKRGLMIERGLHLCDVKCPTTGLYCRRVFLGAKALDDHKKRAKHEFPPINARDVLLRQASKVGGALANGSRPNRRSHSLFEEIIPANLSPYEHEACCYQRFNRIETCNSNQKTDGQLCFLLDCYDASSKMNENQTHEKMRTLTDINDNGLMFCSMKAKSQDNGDLLSKEQIRSWNSLETTRRRKGNIGGETRLKSLTTQSRILEKHKEKNPNQYWNVVSLKNNILITAMSSIFEVKGMNAKDKFEKLTRLNLNKKKVDEMMTKVKQRIYKLDSRIQQAKDTTFNSG